ncbi:MAG: hypothetical protein F6J96_12650 [Symploca sp. SIO1C2]|nr:hypothetical protein [Symploca sp. SIO1C2]
MALTATITNLNITDPNKAVMDPKYHLMYIDVIREVNKIPTAQLIVLDGNPAKQEFSISNSDFFAPGQEIQIQLRDNDSDNKKDQTIFKGIIVRHRIKADKNGSYLTLDLKDTAFKLTTQRKSQVFQKQTDIDIIKSILDSKKIDYQIQTPKTETFYQHQELVQYYCTDWDFILSRADANGQWVLFKNGQLIIQPINLQEQQANKIFNYGISSIYDFEMELDRRQEYNSIEGQAWDIVGQKLLEESATNPDCTLLNPVPIKEKELQAWVKAKKSKSEFSKVKGYIKINGDSRIKLGDLIELKGIGARFNGGKIVTGVRHQVSENGWLTDVQFGLSADWFAQGNDIVDTPAAGLVPAINGLHIGIVQDGKEADPEGHYRIQVWVPAFGEKKEAIVWARWSSPYAGKERGMFFKPEKDDEVVLGFFNDDPRQAVILGSMYSKANPPNKVFIDNNSEDNIQGIVTKDGNKILLVDSADPDFGNILDNLIKLSEEGIEINNKFADNLIELNNKGIEIDTEEEVNIKTTKSGGFKANKLQA